MASSCVVPVVEIKNVREHPQAALLALADVLGYQMVITLIENPRGNITRCFHKNKRDDKGKRVPVDVQPKNSEELEIMIQGSYEAISFSPKYKNGDKCVYFPSDVLIPAEWADKFGVRAYLKGAEKDRVGRVKLRGEPSFGLVVDIPEGQNWKLGDNVSEFFGVTKYEPPIKIGCADMAPHDENIDPFFFHYTDIENGRLMMDIFQEGEDVCVSEKIHGANDRVSIINGNEIAGSHTVRKTCPIDDKNYDTDKIKHNRDWFPWSLSAVQNLLREFSQKHKQVILFGEVYGGSVQTLNYNIPKGKGLGYRAFDLMLDGKYVSFEEFKLACETYGVEMVPVLYRGPFSFEKIKELADGNSTMPGVGHIREGVVCKSVIERTDAKIGRVILKYIGTEYQLSKHADQDTKDV